MLETSNITIGITQMFDKPVKKVARAITMSRAT
jgi:hypothetical protein